MLSKGRGVAGASGTGIERICNMATIKKPDANPVVALLLTWFVFGLGHLLINGQQRKWMYTLIAGIIGSFLFFIPGMIIGVCSIIDAYQTADRLSKGEEIGENEYTFEPLYKIMSFIDKTATLKGAAPAA
jgi:uncharacterized membrane protein YedE/YeeE